MIMAKKKVKQPMMVKATKGFVYVVESNSISIDEGQVFELPEGQEWMLLVPGFVVPVRDQEIETAVIKPAEKTTKAKPKPKKKGAVNKTMTTKDLGK
jgi:hypothetical protein